MTLALGKLDKPALHLLEHRRRQWPVISALAVSGAHVRPGPDEAVAFGEHDPGSLVIEAKATLGRSRDFDCFAGIGRWGMRDRQNTYRGCPVFKRRNNCQHQSGAVLVTVLPSVQTLPMPEMGIAKDPADFWFSRQHACPSAVRT